MTKPTIQIATDIVSSCLATVRMKSRHRQLLIGMIAEALEKRGQEGHNEGYSDGLRDATLENTPEDDPYDYRTDTEEHKL